MAAMPTEGRRRTVIEGVTPTVDGGRYPIKRVVGDEVVVEADVFADGHDGLACFLRWRGEGGGWRETPMRPIGNDRWRASFRVDALGRCRYTVSARLAGRPGPALTTVHPELEVVVDRERARFGAWYEMFPRSAATDPGRHGTLADVEKRLPYVAEMGFDVLYLPPIHPIGRTGRKGANESEQPGPEDPGSPWAIGSEEGGHTAIHPELGTLEDFDRLVEGAAELGLEIAMDLAFHCSPDHPWVREHPGWFRRGPDGTVAHAENPPKRYQDVYPLDFETEDWRSLWAALRSVVDFWVARGVRIFRADNPHTKPHAFWEWLISEEKAEHPDVIFLAEAFTRPKVMARLAKVGFSQSYTYFAWRSTKAELEEYFGRDLPALGELLRPSLWPNTPDVLTEQLQTGGRAAFAARLVLAATLGASYGIYGPPFELMEADPLASGAEEYLHSEKYETRNWDLDRPDSLAPLIARVNAIRRAEPALQTDRTLRFHPTDDEQLIAYSKHAGRDMVLVAVSLDPHARRSGGVELSLEGLDVLWAVDLLSDETVAWTGRVEIDPAVLPARILKLHTSEPQA